MAHSVVFSVLHAGHRVWELEQQLKQAERCDDFTLKQPPLNFKACMLFVTFAKRRVGRLLKMLLLFSLQ